MNLGYLSSDDWARFAQEYPRAEMFLLGRALAGELSFLRSVPQSNAWQQARLVELEHWNVNTSMQGVVHEMP